MKFLFIYEYSKHEFFKNLTFKCQSDKTGQRFIFEPFNLFSLCSFLPRVDYLLTATTTFAEAKGEIILDGVL
jgi:hypothetical protein